MASLGEILKDPNYVNANAATKKAIFDKYAPQDPNYSQANEATQQAIRAKFGIEAIAAPAAPSEIPSARKDRGIRERIGEELSQFSPTQLGRDIAGGAIRGAGSIGASILRPFESKTENEERRAKMDAALQQLIGADPEAFAYAVGKFGAEVAGTAGAGGALAKGAALIPGVAKLAPALASGGFQTGMTGVPNVAAKLAGGAVTGAVGAAAVNPDEMATGAAIGAAVPVVVPAVARGVGKVAGKAVDFATGRAADVAAAKIARDAAEQNLPAILAATKNAPAGITAGQAAYGVDADMFQALAAYAEKKDPTSYYRALRDLQGADQVNELARIAGGATQTGARGVREASKNALTQVTMPMKEAELLAANVGAIKPLDTQAITASLQARVNDPKIGVSDINRRVLSTVGRKLDEWAERGGGVIDAQALYEIRKNAVNETVERLMRGSDPSAQAKRAAGLLSEVRPLIDDAIEAAGGTGWRNYLKTFESGMHGIEQSKLGAKALELYRQSPDAFLKLVRGNDPKAVEKVFGPGSYDIVKEMGAKMAPLEKVASELERDIVIGKQATAGTQALGDLLNKDTLRIRFPNLLNRTASIANKTLDVLEGKINEKTMKVLSEGMKSGKSAYDLLTTLPTSERSKVLQLLINDKGWVNEATAPMTAGVANALSPRTENRNALAAQ